MDTTGTCASEDLRNEHEGILLGLRILEKMTGLLGSGKTVEREDLLIMIDFLRTFADKCHHGKEERILFPAMEKCGIPNEGGPIEQMLKDHAKSRTYIDGMAKSIERPQIDTKEFIINAIEYINLLRCHITNENTILFPLGDRAIAPEVQKQILEAFEHHERTIMGPGVHEKLHEILDEFTKKYLS